MTEFSESFIEICASEELERVTTVSKMETVPFLGSTTQETTLESIQEATQETGQVTGQVTSLLKVLKGNMSSGDEGRFAVSRCP